MMIYENNNNEKDIAKRITGKNNILINIHFSQNKEKKNI